MTKLKNEILDTLKKGQDTADVLKEISQIQEALLKKYNDINV